MTLPRLTGIVLRTLATEFLLGMILNLYVALPFPSPLDLVAVAGIAVLVLHIFLAIALVVASVWMVTMARRTPDRFALGASAVTAAGVLLAFLAGVDFTGAGQSNPASFLMTVGFFVAMMATSLLLGRGGAAPAGPQVSGRSPSLQASDGGGDGRFAPRE